MIKNIAALLALAGLLVSSSPALAKPDFPNANLSTPGTDRTLVLPAAADNSPVISLGSAIDPQTGKVVEGLAIIHYKKGFAKPPWAGGGKDKETSSCFSFLAKDAKWKTAEPWVVNPANGEGLPGSFVLSNLTADITKWEDAASFNILGAGSSTASILVADTVRPDGVNEVYFGDVGTEGAIAVTIVWGIFGGRPSARELLEWDMVYDEVDFDWSSTGEADKMDFENIATHELGHAIGMGHPDDSCSEETMYRFAGFGEVKKRTLEAGDIAGADKLY